ncbi:hypothetical protein ABZY45_07065 [Streptomyces sp. NPDC006516]|uniref:hypothetical protein n=1 Tax=Streptomyces sp. NPDC006516 TaxID=3154309 RepID=UPI00339FBE97
MATLSRRWISRTVGTSCLAAAIALPGVGSACAAPTADRAAVGAAHGTDPPPSPEPPGTPEPPEQPSPPQEENTDQGTESPGTPPPSDRTDPPDSDPPSDPGKTQEPEKPAELKKEVQEAVANAPKEVKKQVEKALTQMLDLIDDPDTTPAERKAYAQIVTGMTETLKAIADPDTPPEERAAYTKIMKTMSEAVTLSQEHPPAAGTQESRPARAPVALGLLASSGEALGALQDPGTAPTDPKDRKRIQQIVAEACEASKTIADPEASEEEKEEAKKVLASRAAVFKNAQYLDLMKEIKRYKARAACVDTVENRTRQAGWADGSLWGLSDPACAASVAEGARQENSQWHALMACVLRDPFSTCASEVPKD